jgi:hypothetical protein
VDVRLIVDLPAPELTRGGLAETDAQLARRWMHRQHTFLDHMGIVETCITSFSAAISG